MAVGRIPTPYYRKVYAEGRCVACRLLVLYYLPDKTGRRMGVSASGRLGIAVVRNRLRRQVKEAWRSLAPNTSLGQYVFIVRRGALTASFQDIVTAMKGLVKRMETE